jgi:hypothetical protein
MVHMILQGTKEHEQTALAAAAAAAAVVSLWCDCAHPCTLILLLAQKPRQ